MLLSNKTKCCCVLNSILHKFGIANPTKAIGPQKAVTNPASNAVITIMIILKFLTGIPSKKEAFSPNTSVFKGLIKKRLKNIPRIKNTRMIPICDISTCCREPIPHIVNTFKLSAELIVCIKLVIAEVKLPIIIPTSNRESEFRTNKENPSTINPKTSAPIKAKPIKPRLLLKKLIPLKVPKATAKLAPELIPKTYGPANGLLKSVCINMPAIAKDDPATIAIINRGNLNSRTSSSPIS